MPSEAIGHVSNYLQPDSYELENKNVSEFLHQNPLLLLARTCQNIGIELNNRNKVPPPINSPLTIHCPSEAANISTFEENKHTRNDFESTSLSNMINKSTSLHHQSPKYSVITCDGSDSRNNSNIETPPSSSSLIQLARLSLGLTPPKPRQKRRNVNAQTKQGRYDKRKRRDILCSSKDDIVNTKCSNLDYDSYKTSNTVNLYPPSISSTSSSTSPNSPRSTSPMHLSSTSFSPKQRISDMIPPSSDYQEHTFLTEDTSTLYQNRLRDLISIVSNALVQSSSKSFQPSSDGSIEDNLTLNILNSIPSACEQSKNQHIPIFFGNEHRSNDLSTQCLYCGLMCPDIGNLVQHIYSHLATLLNHRNSQSPCSAQLPQTRQKSLYDMLANYTRNLQKCAPTEDFMSTSCSPRSQAPTHNLPSAPSVDQNSLFTAWMNIFCQNVNEPLSLTKCQHEN